MKKRVSDQTQIQPPGSAEEAKGRAVDACLYTRPCICLPIFVRTEGGPTPMFIQIVVGVSLQGQP